MGAWKRGADQARCEAVVVEAWNVRMDVKALEVLASVCFSVNVTMLSVECCRWRLSGGVRLSIASEGV